IEDGFFSLILVTHLGDALSRLSEYHLLPTGIRLEHCLRPKTQGAHDAAVVESKCNQYSFAATPRPKSIEGIECGLERHTDRLREEGQVHDDLFHLGLLRLNHVPRDVALSSLLTHNQAFDEARIARWNALASRRANVRRLFES